VIEQAAAAPLARGGPPATFAQAFIGTAHHGGGRGYVPPGRAKSPCSHDGTLWSEQAACTPSWPLPSTVPAALLQERAGNSPANPVVAACRRRQTASALGMGTKGWMELVGITHVGHEPPRPSKPWPAECSHACHPGLSAALHLPQLRAHAGVGSSCSAVQRLPHLHRFRRWWSVPLRRSASELYAFTGAGDPAPARTTYRRPCMAKR